MVEELTSLINSVGFPIVACVVMFKNNGKLVSALNDLSSTMKVIEVRLSELERGK